MIGAWIELLVRGGWHPPFATEMISGWADLLDAFDTVNAEAWRFTRTPTEKAPKAASSQETSYEVGITRPPEFVLSACLRDPS